MRALFNKHSSMWLIIVVSLLVITKGVFQTHVLAQGPVQSQNQVVIVVLKDQPQIQMAQEVKAEYQPRLDDFIRQLKTLSVKIDGIASAQASPLTRAEEIALAKQSNIGRQVLTTDQAAYQQTLSDIDATTGEMRREIVARSAATREASQATVAQFVTDLGGSVIYYYETINAMAVSIPVDKRAELAAHPDIATVEDDQIMTAAMDVSAVAIGANTWWNNGYTGGAWDVAILDSGIDHSHPALSSQTYIEKRCLDTAASNGDGANDPSADDVNGHGTHVAGTVASTDATYKGIAYGLDVLMNAKAGFDFDGIDGGYASMYWTDAMACVDWALTNGTDDADIINLSYGSVATVDDSGYERFWDAVVDQMDAVVAIAAGNDNMDGSPTINSPSIAYNVISVANVDDKNTTSRSDDTIAATSSRGPTPNGRRKPDLAAPGTNILSTNNNWEGAEPDFVSYSGTSMASPHIAGAATLLMDAGITDPKAIKALMINTAEDKGATGWDAEYGWGYIDLNHLDVHKNDYFLSSISASPAYHFYAGPAFPNDTATLVWNRRAVYTSTYPSTYYNLTDLDLRMYDETTNAQISSSISSSDNVEQVKSDGSYDSVVVKVDSYSSSLDGTTYEPYALATEEGFAYKTGPVLNTVITNISGDPAGPMNTIISVTARVENTGDLTTHNVQLFPSYSSGLTLLSGSTINVGTLVNGSSSLTYTWQFKKTNYQPQTIMMNATSSAYDEYFDAVPHTISGTLNDTCYAKVASTGTIYHFVQEAVNNAAIGDTVKVAGTCPGVEYRGGLTQTVYISKTLTLQGGYTTNNWNTPDPVANPTTLDAQGLGRVMVITGTISPMITGLHITGGDATGLGGDVYGWDAGGGIAVTDLATATISSNYIEHNTATTGGGIHLKYNNTVITGNDIISNTGRWGSGILSNYGTPIIENNTVVDNSASTSGSIYVNTGDGIIRGNTVTTNTATWGGGLYLYGSGSTTVMNNTISGNTASYGGGVYLNANYIVPRSNVLNNDAIFDRGDTLYNKDVAMSTNSYNAVATNYNRVGQLTNNNGTVLNNNTINNNTAIVGGGAYLYDSSSTLTDNTFTSNIASSNGGGVLTSNSNAVIKNNLFENNSADLYGGGGFLYYSSDTLTNNVFMDNQATGVGRGLSIEASTPKLSYNTFTNHSVNAGSGVALYIKDDGSSYSNVVLTNTIVVSHAAGVIVDTGNSVTLNNTLWFGNGLNAGGASSYIYANNDYTDDPAFDADGYHLTMRSAAINKGVSTSAMDDIDGDARPQGIAPDLGADEVIIPTLSIAVTALLAQLPSDGTIDPGDTIIYTVVVTNNGDLEVPTVHITDPLPAGLSGSSLDVTVDIPSGQSVRYSVNATVNNGTKGQDIVNHAYFSQPIIGGGSAQTTFTVNPIYAVYLPAILNNYFSYFNGNWEIEPNDDAATQANGPIVSGNTYSGALLPGDPKDYFYIILTDPHTVEAWLTNIPSGQDYDLVLRDSSLTLLNWGQNTGSSDEHILSDTLSPGKYYIQIVPAGGSTGSSNTYQLKVTYR